EATEKSESAKELPLREVAAHAKVTIHQVLASASLARPGTVLEAGVEGEPAAAGTDFFFEVMVLDASSAVWELKVDPATGKVTSNEPEPDAKEAQEMTTLAAKLGSGHLSLDDLATRAESMRPGSRVLVAAFRVHDGLAVARLTLEKNGAISSVTIDARSGKVVA